MALPLPQGLVPAEVSFLCEMELVTVVPRQRLDPIRLLGGETPALRPPRRAVLPLWLALLLKRQRRANIVAPPWLHPASLQELVRLETRPEGGGGGGGGAAAAAATGAAGLGDASQSLFPSQSQTPSQSSGLPGMTPAGLSSASPLPVLSPPPPPPARANGYGTAHRVAALSSAAAASASASSSSTPLSAPFLPSATAEAPAGFLPYHWFELAEILLAHAPDDMPAPPGDVRSLLRDLAEARAAKVRQLAVAVANDPPPPSALPQDPAHVARHPCNLHGIGAMELAESRGLMMALHNGVRRLGAAAESSRREEEEAEDADGGGLGGAYDDDDDDMTL